MAAPSYDAILSGLQSNSYKGLEYLAGENFDPNAYQAGEVAGNAAGTAYNIATLFESAGLADAGSLADETASLDSAAADESGVTGTCLANSFSADTQVATDHGEVAISDLKVGDKVLAYNAQTGKDEYQPIEAVLVHNDPALEDLTIDGETIHTTPGHPFYTQDKGWVAADNLTVGEAILKADGSYGKVQAVKLVDRAQVMYNLTVHADHDYFVGGGQWLVHNESCAYNAQDLGSEYKENGQRIFRQWEADTGARLANDYLSLNPDITSLSRYNDNLQGLSKAGDWIDNLGTTYDGVSVVPHPRFKLPQFLESITDHMIVKRYIDFIVVDTTGLTNPDDIAAVINHTRDLAGKTNALNYLGLGPGWANFR